MIRERAVVNLRELAVTIGIDAEGSQWHLFGSVDRNQSNASDIDLLILCKSHEQADALRKAISPDALELPIHLALMTFDEAAEIDAVRMQRSHAIFP